MHSVEMTLDDAADAQIRVQWQELVLAGLPSQARHTGSSNRPHVTAALSASIGSDVQARLLVAAERLPIPALIGGLLIFGTRRFVLARLVVPSAALLDLQSKIMASLAEPLDPHHTFGPGRWTPHVTLARRLTPDQVGTAVSVLGELEPLSAGLVRARRWDTTARQEVWLDPGSR